MAIKNIKFEGNDFIEEGNISFANSNIAVVVGMNGSGKSVLMKNIKNNFKKSWVKQIVLKEDIIEIEKPLKEIFNAGNAKKKFEKFIEDVKDDGMKKQKNVLNNLDDFIWERYISSYKHVILENYEDKEAKLILSKLKNISKKNLFNEESIKDIDENLITQAPTEKHVKASKKLQEIWDNQFGNPKVVSVDMQEEITLSGEIHTNGVGRHSLRQTLMEGGALFVRFMNISKLDKDIHKIVIGEKEITEDHLRLMNEWLGSYISQDIKVNIEILGSKYSITFYEIARTSPINFSSLSSGTQNLLKIMSQLKTTNSETIVQIDEPETGMHPIMQIQFRSFLEDMTNKYKTRFIIYTHSTHIVKEGVNTIGLNIMSRKKGISKIYTKDEYVEENDILDIQIFEHIGFESIEKNYAFDPSAKTIIVEGDTDVLYLKKMIKLLDLDFRVIRTKIGGATTIDKTAILLNAVHDFPIENIILSPDLDVEEKHPKIWKKISNGKLGKFKPVGSKNRKEIEGMFGDKDKKFIGSVSSNDNTKLNRANLFWRDVNSKDQLSPETINNFNKYFENIS